jgi:hypothetical protein
MIEFSDRPDFRPSLTPREMFLTGSFGGTHWRPIYSAVTRKRYTNQHKKEKDNKGKPCFRGISDELLCQSVYDKTINKYGVKCGSSLEAWEGSGWIHPQDPYGWVQWYTRFYYGRRTADDDRQIKRWKNIKVRFGK